MVVTTVAVWAACTWFTRASDQLREHVKVGLVYDNEHLGMHGGGVEYGQRDWRGTERDRWDRWDTWEEKMKHFEGACVDAESRRCLASALANMKRVKEDSK